MEIRGGLEGSKVVKETLRKEVVKNRKGDNHPQFKERLP